MMDRLGKVLYWTGWVAAALSVLVGLFGMPESNTNSGVFIFILFVVVAAGCLLVGRAFQYILSG
jgi:hypothetical protein